ncbi:MAG TPA: ABC transporter substrate-binding protein [Desulfuromonadales bacterium]|nr:ABC transporter substrate-binding protein [Desulfuromonadales bacterium]
MRYISLLLLILFLSASPAQALEKVTLQLKWLHHFQFAGYYAALEKGFYTQAGLDVTIREGGPATNVEAGVLSGETDFGVGTSSLLLHRAKGADLVVVGQIFQHSAAILLTTHKTGIHSVSQMVGHRFMYTRQSADTLALLKLNGIDESRFIKVNHQGDPRDLINGKADVMMAYVFNEPFLLEEVGEPYLTFSPLSSGIDFYGDNFFTTKRLIEDKPELVKAFREATLKGWRYALDNRGEIADLILSKYSRSKSREWLLFEANQIETLIQPALVELGYQNPSRWEKIAETFVAQGMLPKGFDPQGIIYNPVLIRDHRMAIAITILATIIITVLTMIVVSFRRLNQRLRAEMAEREKAEADKKLSEDRFRTLFETSPTGIILIDAEGIIRFANRRMAEMFGCSMGDLIGSSYPKHIHPTQRTSASERLQKLLSKEVELVGIDKHFIRYDQSDFWGHFCACRQEDAAGNLLFLFGHIADITERITAEENRNKIELQVQQAQKLESLGVLAGGIAHDFNNILMAILGNAELALMRLNPESPVIENLHRIETSAARAADLAKQMLAYSGKGKFIVEEINLNRLLEEMLHLLEVSISKKAVLRFNLNERLPTVKADATQIRQIIMNLVINSSEAVGDRSGIIAITTGCMDCDRNYLKDVWLDENLTDGLYVYLEIADTGCGMEKETLSRLFDPFFTTKFTGRGLGMSAVLGIVRGHHGAIKVYSEVGKGTSFKILLPASEKPAEVFNGHTVSDTWKGSGLVLLVDDEETVRGIGTEMLKELGFTTLTAGDGREALELFKQRTDISFVIMDLTMPKMDGEQCYREMRQHKPDVKVIMSSGYSEQEVSGKFIGKGLAGFVQKPYTLSALREVIRGMP